ncbi:hypothetical protein HPP92_002806 [Vanilla planifolia]|uniref:Uncharacterized protein n=1 Tax=Vanilla planifolia TaxID=51239 RepID=A0A835VIC6_VANPL|nr:hypothetical protein HPP92_002806 [Vanilla planifolia]
MRERSSSAKKHGEVSWPKIIFRKWLNLNNKESDFSADERDNNTDFDEEVEEEEGKEAILLLRQGSPLDDVSATIEELLLPKPSSERIYDRVHPLTNYMAKLMRRNMI